MAQPRYQEISMLKQIRDALFTLIDETRRMQEMIRSWQGQDEHYHGRQEDILQGKVIHKVPEASGPWADNQKGGNENVRTPEKEATQPRTPEGLRPDI